MWCGVDVGIDKETNRANWCTIREFESKPHDHEHSSPNFFDWYDDKTGNTAGYDIDLPPKLELVFLDMLIREFGNEEPKFLFPMNEKYYEIKEKIQSLDSL